jgi:hypothetical protein
MVKERQREVVDWNYSASMYMNGGPCQHGTELFGSIAGRQFLDQLSFISFSRRSVLRKLIHTKSILGKQN